MKTRKRLSAVTSYESKRLQICDNSDYSVQNLSINLQPVWNTTHNKSRALVIGAFLRMKQGIWFTILPTSEENLDISSALQQDRKHILILFLNLGLIRLRVVNYNNVYPNYYLSEDPTKEEYHLWKAWTNSHLQKSYAF